MTKTIQRPLACLSAVVMVIAMLLYFPGGIFSNISFGLKASAEGTTNDLTLSAVAGEPKGLTNEEYTELFDNDTGTKWCCNFSGSAYVIFKASEPVKVSKYSIATAGDTNSFSNRNPRNWTLSACRNYPDATTSWTVIDTVTNGGLPTANETYTDFTLAETTPYYQYFKLEITSIIGGNTLQISEIALKDYTLCEHQWKATGETFAPTCAGDGYYVEYCPLCQETRNISTEDALGHDFVDEVCTRCGGADTTPIEPLTDEYGVYQIETSGELYWFANYVNSGNTSVHAVLTANIVVNTGVLKSDGTLADDVSSFTSWTPVGWYDEYNNRNYIYTGTFDGQGHTISGLYFNDDGTDYVGLFGRVGNGGSVSNVGVVDSYCNGYDYVGGVCGENRSGTVTNCYYVGAVTAFGDYAYVGGVCGYNEGTVTNCYYTGAVTASGDYAYVGGVCGYNEGTVTNSYHTGTVTAAGDSAWVGGVCGMNSITITNCYHTGAVTATGNLSEIGGVCGDNWDTVTNCYFDSTVYIGNAVGADYATDTTAEGKTTAEFNSGKVAYLLQGTQTKAIWGQNIGTDNYPVLGGAKVYQIDVYEGCEVNPGNASTGYANTDAPVYAEHSMTAHPANAATCTKSGNYAYWTCSREDGVYYKDEAGTDTFANLAATVIPALEHEDTDNDGYCNNGCGKPVRLIVKEVSATLDGDIGLNYYIALPESVTSDEGAYVQFNVNGENTKVYVKDATAEEDGTYKFTCWLTAKEMRDTVTFELYDGSGTNVDIYKNSGEKIEGASFDYSLETYFDALSSDEDAALKALADATLIYGAYAQNAFNHNADPTLNGSELADVTVDTLETNKMTKSADIPEGLKLTEMTLILETETTLRLYFKSENIGNYTFKLDGSDVTLNTIAEEGLYYVEIANISAKNLDTMHTLEINGECTLTFNSLSYAYAVLKTSNNDDLCNVVKALYKYNEAANAYFSN